MANSSPLPLEVELQSSQSSSASLGSDQDPVVLLVDGHSLAYRAFYAFFHSREGGLRTSTGIPTSVCFGFLKALLEVIEKQAPTHVAVAFDTRQPTFRHEMDDTYKAGRPETPPEFIEDIENLKLLLEALNIPILMAPGFEADDVLGTLAVTLARSAQVRILSGDQDLFQLIDAERIRVLHLNSKDKVSEFGPAEVMAKLGIRPEQVVDYKALCGDSSDNIPGVKGIGQKRAVELLAQFGDLETLLSRVDDLKGAMRTRIQEGVEAARHSQQMAQIRLDVPLPWDWEGMRLTGFEQDRLIPLLQKLEFHSQIRQVQRIQERLGGALAQDLTEDSVEDRGDDESLWFDFAQQPLPAAPQMPPVQIIDTAEKLAHLVQILAAHTDLSAWDTETTSLSPRDAELVGIGCCWSPVDIAYIPIGHSTGPCLEWPQVKAALDPIWQDPARPKTLQNCKYDLAVLRAQGSDLKGVSFDPMIASYLLDPEANHNLTDLAAKHLGLVAQSYQDLVKKGQTIADIEIPNVAQYCGCDAYCTYQLTGILKAALETDPRLWKLFQTVELPLALILEQMEWIGIRVDVEFLSQLSQDLAVDLDQIEQRAYAAAGETFNLNSPKQLGSILFEKLGLSTQKTRRNKSGTYSTDAAVLEKLEGDHPIIDQILAYRTLAKLKSTYVDALPQLVRPDTQRVHTHFNQTVTATGRLSSSDPNLQNIPIRTEFSRRIRQAFVPASGWLLVAADYSQIELRILAHLSQEQTLVEGFQAGEDVHTLTAKVLLNKSDITPAERRLAKTINYGVVYGMGAQRFARTAGVSHSEAKDFLAKFNRQYAGIFEYLQSTEALVQKQGYVETITGRRRYFHSLKTLTGYRKQAELRAAINAPIQGSASDIIKLAMVNLAPVLQPYRSQLLLQVHDELVFEVDPDEWADLQPRIRQAMEQAFQLSVPLTVDIQAGSNWMEAK